MMTDKKKKKKLPIKLEWDDHTSRGSYVGALQDILDLADKINEVIDYLEQFEP